MMIYAEQWDCLDGSKAKFFSCTAHLLVCEPIIIGLSWTWSWTRLHIYDDKARTFACKPLLVRIEIYVLKVLHTWRKYCVFTKYEKSSLKTIGVNRVRLHRWNRRYNYFAPNVWKSGYFELMRWRPLSNNQIELCFALCFELQNVLMFILHL